MRLPWLTTAIDTKSGRAIIDKLLIRHSTFRGDALLYVNGDSHGGIVFRNNRFQFEAGPSAVSLLYQADRCDPDAARFDSNEWYGPASMDFYFGKPEVSRVKYPAFAERVGETGQWVERPAANPAAGLESFTGKETAGAIAEVRTGKIDTTALLEHLREGLQ